MSFADLKKQSKAETFLTQKLVKEVEKMNNAGSSGDDRLWKLEVDKGGNGYAVIRFLPAPTVKICRSSNCTLMLSRVLVDGTLRTL